MDVQRRVADWWQRTRQRSEPPPVTAVDAHPEPATLARRPGPPVPEGTTLDELAETMRSLSIDASPPGELAPYVDDALWRFLHTLGTLQAASGRALELGANPYFMTWLLRRYTDLDLTLANYFDWAPGHYEQRVTLRGPCGDDEFTAAFDHFNLETDTFPYDDGAFDVVVFCEIIEHLTNDPVRVLREIHRVLRPGGTLALSTPNVARLRNVVSMIQGVNIYDPYSGYGPYGRHNREYNPHELALLLDHCGFSCERIFTADAHHEHAYDDPVATAAAAQLVHREGDLGQYVFVVARASGTPREGLPRFLYRSYPEAELTDP